MYRLQFICAVMMCVNAMATQARSEPTKQEYVDYVVSTASFLEQCSSRNVIETGDVQNQVLYMAKDLGLFTEDYWTPLKQGADGVVYDLLRQRWIRMDFSVDKCAFVLTEQNKVYKSFKRYY